jgi:hypothetical protein
MKFLGAVVVLAGCQQTPEQAAQSNRSNGPAPAAPLPANDTGPMTPAPPEPGTSGGLPDDRTPIAEPNGPIDPKSAEAAGQAVQHYAALIEQKHFAEAEKYWGNSSAAGKQSTDLKRWSEAHFQVGKPHGMEGAAGSIFITVPVVLYGVLEGRPAHRNGDAILRRVNDVPGSTEAQRRWHIERIDWAAAG